MTAKTKVRVKDGLYVGLMYLALSVIISWYDFRTADLARKNLVPLVFGSVFVGAFFGVFFRPIFELVSRRHSPGKVEKSDQGQSR
jgi:hypothetical protein